ncbi:YesL family protein [Amphibacillus sediminis]|uniref:YesL family protein n=1 Tax=Amphibacillus sediminis TaxID=360185 RepID=UPI000833714E|nr:DUF624 domain-containing protein [Amphibacillus sediminis]
MIQNGVLGRVYAAFEFVYRLIYLNLLWFSFTLLGAVIFGIGPSTIALYHLIRKWLKKELGNDRHIFVQYFQAYKANFKSGNIIGLSVMLLFFMFLVNYRYSSMHSTFIFQYIQISTLILACLTTVILTYLIPLYVHYDLKLKDYFSRSVVIALAHPLPTLLNIGWLVMIGYLFYQFFPFSLLVGVSSLAYGIMGISYSSFVRNEQIREEKKAKSAS